MAVAFFDLDRTLIDTNSGKLWVRSEWKAGRLTVNQMAHALWWMFKYSLGDKDLVHAFEAAVAALEGEEEAIIVERTGEWFAREVAHRLRPGAERALERHRAAGDRLVLATGGTIYASREAGAAWGIEEFVCTVPEVADGVFTGRIEAMAFGQGKLDLARAWAEREGERLEDAWFYSDSATDLPLLEAVGHPVVVAPDRKLAKIAAERGWEVVDWS